MQIKLSHSDDGKGKSRSHTIEFHDASIPCYIGGYGASKEEALDEFKLWFKKYLSDLIEFDKKLDKQEAVIIEEDY